MSVIPTSEDLIEVYEHAANLIRERGWWGRYNDNQPNSLCLMNAIGAHPRLNVAITPRDRRLSYVRIEDDIRGRVGLEWPCSPVYWNDTPGRTKEQVLQVLDDAIRDLKASIDREVAAS